MKKSGFTLIELLLVISIIALLASIVISSSQDSKNRARTANIIQSASSLKNVAEMYRNDHNDKYVPDGAQQECPTTPNPDFGFFGTPDGVKIINSIKENSPNKQTPFCAGGSDTWVLVVAAYGGTVKLSLTPTAHAASYIGIAFDQDGKQFAREITNLGTLDSFVSVYYINGKTKFVINRDNNNNGGSGDNNSNNDDDNDSNSGTSY